MLTVWLFWATYHIVCSGVCGSTEILEHEGSTICVKNTKAEEDLTLKSRQAVVFPLTGVQFPPKFLDVAETCIRVIMQ